MKDFEKKIIEVCKEKNVRKFFVRMMIIWAIVAILLIMLALIFRIWMSIIYLVLVILLFVGSVLEKAAQKIKLTDEKVFYRNNFWSVILSDKDVCNQICFGLALTFINIFLRVWYITTGSSFIDILLGFGVACAILCLGDQIAKFFKNKLK